MKLKGVENVVRRYATTELAIFRRSVGTYSAAGYYQPGASDTVYVLAHVQPMSGREVDRLPEGYRLGETIKLFSNCVLQTAEGGSNPADRFDYRGRRYVVGMLVDWEVSGGYYMYAAVLDEAGDA